MRLLFLSQLRFVAHAPWSAATALLGVALGVASVVAVHLISSRVVHSLAETAPLHLAGLTHVLEHPELDAERYFDLRERWRLHPDSPVLALVPVVEGYAGAADRRVRVLGADWLAMPSPGPAAVGPADALPVPAEVLVGEAVLADDVLGVTPGAMMAVSGRHYRVSATRDTGLGAAVVADIAAAQQMLGVGAGHISRIGLARADPWESWRRWLERLMPGFSAGLPAAGGADLGHVAAGLVEPDGGAWRMTPVAAQRPSAEFARSILFNLGALGSLALLVAWFLIYQVGVIWLRRQRLLLQRLYALGVSQGDLRRSFMAVFLALGALATVIGVILGMVLAATLTGLASRELAATAETPVGVAAVDGWVLLKAVASGLGVCLLGGLGAFSREWRDTRLWAGWRWLLPPVLGATILTGITFEDSGVLGGFLAIFAMSVGGVALVSPVLGVLRRMVVRLRGSLLTRLAMRDVAWHPRMLGVALAALSLAVATSIGIALMVESFRNDFERMLAVRLAGDVYAYAEGSTGQVSAWLEAQPGVADHSRFGGDQVRVGGVPVELGYARFDAAESARYGHGRALGPAEALVSERLARDLDVDPGDALALSGSQLLVVGVFPGYGDAAGRLLVDVSSLGRLGIEPRYDRVTATLAPGTDVAELIRALAARFPGVEAESRGELRAVALRIFDRTFAVTQALTLLAVVVAVVGTYNALTALKLHQAPTSALLRAQGVTVRQIRRIALLRAAAVGGIAMALALPLGFAMAWTLCAVINPRSFGWTVELSLPVSTWLPPLVLGTLAALLAGVLPAPRERGALHEGS